MANQVLKDELTNDLLGRGYAAMSDQAAADDLNTVNRPDWQLLSSSEIFEAIDAAEFTALSAAARARIDRILGLGAEIRTAPGSQSRNELISVFGAGSTTITALAAQANPQQSRATELGLGIVRAGHVAEARA